MSKSHDEAKAIRVQGYTKEESRSLKSLAPKTLYIAVHGAERPLFVQDFDSQ